MKNSLLFQEITSITNVQVATSCHSHFQQVANWVFRWQLCYLLLFISNPGIVRLLISPRFRSKYYDKRIDSDQTVKINRLDQLFLFVPAVRHLFAQYHPFLTFMLPSIKFFANLSTRAFSWKKRGQTNYKSGPSCSKHC